MSTNEIEAAPKEMVELQPQRQHILREEPSVRNDEERTQDPQSPHSSVQVDDEMTINIEAMIQKCGSGRLLPKCCIYRVPIKIRDLNKEAYTPTVVSIGPLHYGNKRLQDMERHKKIMFNRFIERATRIPKFNLGHLVGEVKCLEPDVRVSYSETIILSKQELVKLTLIDAGFIIELLVMCHERSKMTDAKLSKIWLDDSIRKDLSTPWLDDSIRKDLLLIENQLPFFAIEKLFNKAFPRDHCDSPPPLLQLTYEYFEYFNKQDLEHDLMSKIEHFTDLLRLFYLPEKGFEEQELPRDGSGHLLYNANALQAAGIQFKVCDSKCLLDLKFSGHTLEIPHIFVEDTTELVFRNMIALEQCHYPYEAYITDYAFLMDCLFDTPKDVDLLVDKKIVRHYLGDSKNVAELFNGLWKNIIQSNFNPQYLYICKRLNRYCHDPWHKRKATLRRDYFNTPWHTAASIAGIILLVLTIVQTIFSVLQVVLK